MPTHKFERLVKGNIIKYFALLILPVLGELKYVAFKVGGFRAPYAQNGVVDVAELCEKDQALLAEWKKANKTKREKLEGEFAFSPILADILEKMRPGDSTRILDLLTEEEYGELALPPKTLLEAEISQQAEELGAKNNEIKQLKARVAELEKEKGSDPPQGTVSDKSE